MLSKREGHTRLHERGQVVVIFALLVPVFLGLGSIVLGIGNWYVHKKHLQTLVDAGAFAGGMAFSACHQNAFQTNLDIKNAALKYAGDPTRDPTTENNQLQQPNDVHVVLNSNRYWSKGTPTDGTTYDNTLGEPCALKSLDVKATDLEAPLIWRWIPLFPSPKAKAKVEIVPVKGQNGMLPWAVPEVDPKWVAALIVDEDEPATSNNSIEGAAVLPKQQNPAPPLDAWNTFAGNVSGLSGFRGNYSVVIVVSRDTSADPNTLISGSLDNICNRNPVQTKCWAGDTPTSGLSFIRAYSDPGSPVAINSVDLASASCPGSLTAPYFALNGPCSVSISKAVVNFGVNGDPRGMPTCGRVLAGGSPLQWVDDGSQFGYWEGTSSISLNPGRNPITMTAQVKRPNGNNCNQQTTAASELVAAPYLADDNSGPVEYLRVDNADPPGGLGNNINKSPPDRNFYVTVGLTRPFEVTDNWSDPPMYLRITTNSSQTQAVDCDNNTLIGPTGLRHSNFRNEIVDGCLTFYTENTRNGDCSNYSNPGDLPPPTELSDPVDDCVVTQTGVSSGQIRQALQDRFGGNPCKTTNNWPKNALDPYPDPLVDKRYIVLFIVDDTAFTGSGQQIFPVRRFGGFYLTGGDGLNCPGDDPPPPGGRQASAWGHFMTYTSPDPDAIIKDDEFCNFDEVGTCVAVLVE